VGAERHPRRVSSIPDNHPSDPASAFTASQSSASLRRVGVHNEVLSGPVGPLARIWAATCDSATVISSLASVTPGFGFARVGGTTTVHVRGPVTAAVPMHCPPDTEYFGADFRLGTHLPMFPRTHLADGRDHLLPTRDGRIVLDGRAWEMPTPQNVDVFVERLARDGLLVVDDLRFGRSVPERTVQSRFLRAVGVSRRTVAVIERARLAACLLRDGTPIADVVEAAGYHDQPHLTRSLRAMVGHTPAEIRRGGMFLDV
jgi:AraC-like DNA-binding protein